MIWQSLRDVVHLTKANLSAPSQKHDREIAFAQDCLNKLKIISLDVRAMPTFEDFSAGVIACKENIRL